MTNRQPTVRVWAKDVVIPTCLPLAPDKNLMFLDKRAIKPAPVGLAGQTERL
jgi:hypothetical protein